MVATLCGCSLLSKDKGSLTDYEATKQSIDGDSSFGDTEYRMEGVSADKERNSSNFLKQLGLRRPRQKNRTLAKQQYQEAEKLFEQARNLEGPARARTFREAADQYEVAATNWRSSDLEQDALLMSAESSFFAEDYYRAEQYYGKLVKEYPRNPYLDHINSRQFEIADFWIKLARRDKNPFAMVNFSDPKEPWNDTGGHGKRVLEKLRIDNPTGKISDDATMRLAMEQYEKGDFEEAAHTFADLRLTYPDSEHMFNAQFFEVQSLLASYQGPKYSSIPLTEAQDRVIQLAKQFPTEAAQQQQELNRAYANIRFQMAERIWNAAQYRMDRGENGSAKFHYNRILSEFEDTPFAAQAREQLAEIADAPDDPPQRFRALLMIFGDKSNQRPWLNDRAQ